MVIIFCSVSTFVFAISWQIMPVSFISCHKLVYFIKTYHIWKYNKLVGLSDFGHKSKKLRASGKCGKVE